MRLLFPGENLEGLWAAMCQLGRRFGVYLLPVALEAAHIKWQQTGGPDTETNGLALCLLHQRLFDRGAFTLSKQLQIMVSDEAYGSAGFQEWLMGYHGEMLNFPQRKSYCPNERYIDWHVREVSQGECREK